MMKFGEVDPLKDGIFNNTTSVSYVLYCELSEGMPCIYWYSHRTNFSPSQDPSLNNPSSCNTI